MTGDEDEGKYLASADYLISDDGPMYLSELRRASLIIRVIVFTKSYFSTKHLETTQSEGEIFLQIFLRKLTEDVYTLDFDREHMVGVALPMSSHGPKRVQPIGYMQFVSPSDERNLWDFRRTVPVATDYAGMVTTRIGAHHEQPDLRAVEWLPESSCQDFHQGAL